MTSIQRGITEPPLVSSVVSRELVVEGFFQPPAKVQRQLRLNAWKISKLPAASCPWNTVPFAVLRSPGGHQLHNRLEALPVLS